MPSIPLLRLYQRQAGASTSPPTKPSLVNLTITQIALVSVFSAIIVGIMIFCMHRFWPGLSWRWRRRVDSQPPPMDVKQTFLDVDDEKTLAEEHAPAPVIKQTFLHLDEDRMPSGNKGLRISMHPAMRPSNNRPKRKHDSNRNESLDSTSSAAPLIRKSDMLPASPERTYSPRVYSPRTPPPVPGTSRQVRLSPTRTRPLPTPVQHIKRYPEDPDSYDISPLQSSATLPERCQLPMSFLIEIDAKREDQTRSRTVSPLQHPATPIPDRTLPDSQLSSRNVSPISAPSTPAVNTYPSATPVYLPRPFSKYNPYRPALEPATSKNWPLEDMSIPEHSAAIVSPIRKHISQTRLNTGHGIGAQGRTTPSPTPSASKPDKEYTVPQPITHPELDPGVLADFHRRRQKQKKAKEEQQRQKRYADREKIQQLNMSKEKEREENTATQPTNRILYPFHPNPNPNPNSPTRKRQQQRHHHRAPSTSPSPSPSPSPGPAAVGLGLRLGRGVASGSRSGSGSGLPPRLPSKSRKPSQSPDAYEKARRISGLHELVGDER
jgi:hypothetical protein